MMSNYLLMTLISSVFWAAFIIHSKIDVQSCILEEKMALLNFKASLNVTELFLPSWINIDHHQGRQNDDDCCNWEGVTCSNITRTIVQLHLVEYYFQERLNLTTLLPLKNLQTLDLSKNVLGSAGLECGGMANFKNLHSLNLDWNDLDNDIFHCINQISSLKHLSLAWNYLNGSFPSQEISLMKQLEHLDLSHNDILDTLFIKGICSLKNLIELHLEDNLLSGSIPMCLSNLTSLEYLNLGRNNFSGSIPTLLITKLTQLEYLFLYSNPYVEVSYSLSLFSNHSKLRGLAIGPSHGLCVDFKGPAIPPPFQLRLLILGGCIFNNEIRKIPTFLIYQKELRILDLSFNNLAGEIPNWLLKNNTHLQVVRLRNNAFISPYLLDTTPILQDLRILDISNNEIGGQVAQNIGLLFPNLTHLNLSRNHFQGRIPESLGYLEALEALDLSHNNFFGQIPDQIGSGCVSLLFLSLSNNSLQGYLPSSLMNLKFLSVLYLDKNEFRGELPSWIGNLSVLEILDISQNQLKGTIPDDLCNLTFLFFLDLSENQFHGSLPPCPSLRSLKFIYLQVNQISGSISNALLNGSSSLTTIDFRHNHLSGHIPHEITTLQNLMVLLLGGNNFQGHIPGYICQLKQLRFLDFSQNKFSGEIPSCLNYMSFGVMLDDSSVVTWNYGFITPITAPRAGSNDSSLDPIHDEYTRYVGEIDVQEIVEFMTKGRVNTYEGNILNYMSGLDLSCNQLTGEIPSELGDLYEIRAVNLSHNYLQGYIPSKLSMLSNIESFDLSYNNLSGQIPYELTNLHFLSIFNVSYNDLSGRVPENGQFANFDENNYRGNLNLCGQRLNKHCDTSTADPLLPRGRGGGGGGEEENDDGVIDTKEFFWSFSISFVTAIGTLTLTLYISPYYRKVLSYFIDRWILSRFYCRYKKSRRRYNYRSR